MKANGLEGGDEEAEGMSTMTRPWGEGVSGRMHFIFLCPKIIDILFQLSCRLRGEGERNTVEANCHEGHGEKAKGAREKAMPWERKGECRDCVFDFFIKK